MENALVLLTKYEHGKLIEVIEQLKISDDDKKKLLNDIASNNVDLQKFAGEKLIKSGVAHNDIQFFLTKLEHLQKQDMYATTKLTSTTGSGTIEMQFKGGDRRLIVPVLALLVILIIAILIVFFVK